MPEVYVISQSRTHPRLTVIFIHGTNGNYIRTWGSNDPASNWIYWIAEDLPDADVFSVQHEGNIWSLTDYATITDYAKTIAYTMGQLIRSDHVLLIGHSLGGIIAKQIALIIESDVKLTLLRDKSLDFCFIATPHLGGNFDFARSIVRFVPNRLLGLVSGWNLEIQDINDKFLETRKTRFGGVLCFGERKRFFGLKLMKDSSAFIPDDRAVNLSISKHHKAICKLQSRQDAIYLCVKKLCDYSRKSTLVGESSFEVDRSLLVRAFR